MAVPYIPQVQSVTVQISVVGHQMNAVSETITLDELNSSVAVRTELADSILSVLRLAAEARFPVK